MKSWSADNPKASLMMRKRIAIVDAAKKAFLDTGYAQTSMDRIAVAAGVSIKTVYRHFENKDDLFSAVMQVACGPGGPEGMALEPLKMALLERPWFSLPPRTAFAQMGLEYLHHALSKEQLALYQIVTQDAYRFPEIARRYHDEVIAQRNELFIHYLERWAPVEKWTVKNSRNAAQTFSALLQAGMFDEALHGLRTPEEADIAEHASAAAAGLLVLLDAGIL